MGSVYLDVDCRHLLVVVAFPGSTGRPCGGACWVAAQGAWVQSRLFKGCARCGQREFVHRAVVPPILAPQKPASWASAGSPGLEWARRAPLMLMMRVPAARIMRSRPRAEAASSNLLALHRAVQKHAPTPHGTRARFAAIHQLISSFRVRASDPAGARITSISGTPGTRRRRVGPPLKASPLRLRQALAAHGRGHRRGPLRCPI